MSRILYICYDGLCDPIGQSQILPYLSGCAAKGHRITAISFEKPEALAQRGEDVRGQCDKSGIDWRPEEFHRFPPLLSKAWDMHRMRVAGLRAAEQDRYDIVHGRSYQGSHVALEIKRRFGTPMLFDMRGFWADQRREGGRWRDASPLGNYLYRQWKDREAELLAGADHVVTLTGAARDEIMGWGYYSGTPVSVIPCCTDFDLFYAATDSDKTRARKRLSIAAEAPVLAYLGSIGTVYRFDIHLHLFDRIRQRDPRARMLFIGRSGIAEILAEASKAGVPLASSEVIALTADRADIAGLLAAVDVGTGFCTEGMSSKGVSLTKLGEYLACGVPMIGNDAVGDTAAILHELSAGHSMPDFSAGSIADAADAFFVLRSTDRDALRKRARSMFDLPLAVKGYSLIYDALTPWRAPDTW